MIDISDKNDVNREATASGEIILQKETLDAIKNMLVDKGDPLTISELAGINGSKLTQFLITLAHPVPIDSTIINSEIFDDRIRMTSTVKSICKTGVEMEALTSVTVALLNLWDTVKSHEKDENGQYPFAKITNISVIKKVKN